MTPVLLGAAAALAALVLGRLAVAGLRFLVRTRAKATRQRQIPGRRSAGHPASADHARPDAQSGTAQVLLAARQQADAVVREAEHKAGEILAAAELAKAQVEDEMVEAQRRTAAARDELSSLLTDLLSRVQNTFGEEPGRVLDLTEARETRTKPPR